MSSSGKDKCRKELLRSNLTLSLERVYSLAAGSGELMDHRLWRVASTVARHIQSRRACVTHSSGFLSGISCQCRTSGACYVEETLQPYWRLNNQHIRRTNSNGRPQNHNIISMHCYRVYAIPCIFK